MSFAVRFAVPDDEKVLRALWALCFPGDGKFTNYFFERIYDPAGALVAVDGENPVAMLHMLPYTFRWHGQEIPLSYLYGIGTHPEFRNRGLSRGLMEQALFELHLRGVPLAALIPERDDLFPFYEKQGFSPVFSCPGQLGFDLAESKEAAVDDIEELNTIYERELAETPHVARNSAVWRGLLEETALFGGRVVFHRSRQGYAVLSGGKISEAFGLGAERGADAAPFGCLRVVKAKRLAELSEVVFALVDPLAPWNNGLWDALGREILSADADEPLTPKALIEHVFARDRAPYMNLMHN